VTWKAVLLATFGGAALLGGASCGGCGRSSPGVTSMQPDAGSAVEAAAWVSLRRDLSPCATAPRCGWFAHVLNRHDEDVHVDEVEVALADLAGSPPEIVLDAPDGEVIVLGSIDARRVFVVRQAWRGLPGEAAAATDVRAVTASRPESLCDPAVCARDGVSVLNLDLDVPVATLDFSRSDLPWIDHAWVKDRVLHGGAIIAGRFGGEPGEPVIERFEITRVFVAIPDRLRPCSAPALPCGPGMIGTYSRDEDRCLVQRGCSSVGGCSRQAPACPPGYVLRSWPGEPHACLEFVCDPWFLPE
jgi:hypothetical protein